MESAWKIDVHERHLQPEWMDQPALDIGLHRSALRGLERVNALSLTHRSFWPAICGLAHRYPGRPLRLLDVACGGGDVAIRMARLAQRSGLALSIDGCDLSSTALTIARAGAARAGVRCRFFEFDVQRPDWPSDYDVITTSLFLHHLTTEAAVTLLAKMAATTRHVVLVNDLVRSRMGYLLARYVSHLLSRSPIVHADGPVSVQGAFTIREVRQMAELAGMPGASVRACWPARMLLEWTKQ